MLSTVPKEKAHYGYGTEVLNKFKAKFLNSDAFKREEAAHLKLIAEQQAKKDADYKEKEEAKERKQYERLQKKFEDKDE